VVAKLLLRAYGSDAARGLPIAVAASAPDETALRYSLAEAIRLLEEADVRRWRVVKRYVGHIVIWDGDYTAFDKLGGIHLSAEHLRTWPRSYLASALVHEAIHLRLAARGIRYGAEVRDRIEALCTREQAAFLARLSAAGKATGVALTESLQEPWWTDAERVARIQRNLPDLPQWIRRLVALLNG
jgi:hypothetical protein